MTDVNAYRTRSTRVTAIRVPRSIDIRGDQAPTRDEVYSAALPILTFLGTDQLRSEHATVRIDGGRVQVTIHQLPGKVQNAAGGDWLICDEYHVYTAVDDRTFHAFYEPESAPPMPSPVVEATSIIQKVVNDINNALAGAGWEVVYDLQPIDGHVEPELPADPTGVDCPERYESAADQG